jgi:hypothetical protein
MMTGLTFFHQSARSKGCQAISSQSTWEWKGEVRFSTRKDLRQFRMKPLSASGATPRHRQSDTARKYFKEKDQSKLTTSMRLEYLDGLQAGRMKVVNNGAILTIPWTSGQGRPSRRTAPIFI